MLLYEGKIGGLLKGSLSTKHTDPQLIAACIAKEAWAWDVLVDRYKRLVYSVALRTGLGQDDAADVFQTVFVSLLEHLHTLRAPQGLAAWLITTTKRESWRVSRKQGQERPSIDTEEMAAREEGDGGEGHLDEAALADQVLVQQALEQVGGGCRELLRLLYFDQSQPSYETVSRRLRIPLGSIGPTRARCLQKMRAILQGMGMVPA